MKKVILSIVIALVTIGSACSQDVSETFGVRGNCGMCKATIEKAANNLEGVIKAVWDRENKKVDVSYDSNKTNILEIHKAIAKSGYDTDLVKGDDSVYDNLPGCCQYDRDMEMSL
ncbi:MAG: cation transporter [Flavobacteriaceae bacterium]|nr:cation transporter [Flavobacteriaceae bacterium]